MRKNPLLSIIIPCYKVEKYLNQCLQSVCQSESKEIEIILVDDGSPDSCPQLCDQWACQDERVRVIHQQNAGLSIARNNGMKDSQGDYIWFIDSDDWLVAGAVDYVLSLITSYKDVDVFVSPVIYTYEDSRMNYSDINIDNSLTLTGCEYARRFPVGATPRSIIRRSILSNANISFFPNIVHEDDLFGILLFNEAGRVMVLKDGIYNYRQREGSIMHSVSIRSAYSCITMHKQLMAYMEQRVEQGKQLAFRRRYVYMLPASIARVWHLRRTRQFRQFLLDSRDYRIGECEKCMLEASPSLKKRYKLMAYHPILYIYRYNWKRMLWEGIIEMVKWLLIKIHLFNFLYNYWKKPKVYSVYHQPTTIVK